MVRGSATAVLALVNVITATVTQIDALAEQVEASFGQHPDARIIRSQPGLGTIWARGCSPSSGTTPTDTPTPGPARTTPACHRSPEHPASNAWSWPATPVTGGWPMPCTNKPSRH